MKTFAEQLEQERARLGLKRFELAALLDISYPRPFQSYLKGDVVPHPLLVEGALARLARTPSKLKCDWCGALAIDADNRVVEVRVAGKVNKWHSEPKVACKACRDGGEHPRKGSWRFRKEGK
jgi:hypothetical protein